MASIVGALNRIKDSSTLVITRETIEEICLRHGHDWRERELDPATTVGFFVRQVAEGNISCAAMTQLCGSSFTPQAYCQARKRLPVEVLEDLSRAACQAGIVRTGDQPEYLWKGHRTRTMDGSTFSMPDTPELQEHFPQPGSQKPGCGFPIAHGLFTFDHRNGLLLNVTTAQMNTHDLANVPQAHKHLAKGDVLLGDTAFGTYAHFALLLQGGMHGLFPAHQHRIIDFRLNRPFIGPGGMSKAVKGMPRSRQVRLLGKDDQVVEWFKPPDCPSWLTEEQYDALPESIMVREVRRTVYRKGFRPITLTVVTTLLDAEQYPADDLIELRLRRWDVETNLRHLKTTMGMEVLHCQDVSGVMKELNVFVLVYNLVRMLMMESARRLGVSVDRVSFASALAALIYARAGDEFPRLVVNPLRRGRLEPRCIKRRNKTYPIMTKPREELRKALEYRGNGLS